ncbi:DUF6890 family protein [Avibacterium paragallinarum]|uniref:DUF6890 family protein n=1 Tax=Avibacterium paragallinarum TaxID=728 RepID=UPI000357B706|nr:hypothetical protein [Avibacterium paragallinarum]CDF98009.1 Putative uncharacterized protein [Avibacterium paragallinarum JF4211]
MERLEQNGYAQAIALRMHYLPHADNHPQNLARALWLDKRHWENMANTVANGISKCF